MGGRKKKIMKNTLKKYIKDNKTQNKSYTAD